MDKLKKIPREISWLSFNARVLQEADDLRNPLKNRIRFLGIYSNNRDEFFRRRIAAVKQMIHSSKVLKEQQKILDQIHKIVFRQQKEFERIWKKILLELRKEKVFLLDGKKLTKEQKIFARDYFEREVSTTIIPLFANIPKWPVYSDETIFLGVVMKKNAQSRSYRYAFIEIPTKSHPRFISFPSEPGVQNIMLLEDLIRFNLPKIFSYLGFKHFQAYMFKIIKDSEFEVDNDNPANYIQKITEGIRNRKLGSPISFHYDGRMGKGLLNYLIEKLSLCKKNIFIPGSKIHNFRDFMDFPADLPSSPRRPPIKHPALSKTLLVSDLILKKDLLLHFPFHSFDTIIDLLREAATDKDVKVIKITAYRLAENSKICNALINAVRAGKKVEVVLELMASFDEALNLMWKQKLEEEGVIVYSGVPNYKVHAKICVIKKQVGEKIIEYGFIGTGNLNEKTASLYTDHFLLTSRPDIMADINRIFKVLENPEKNWKQIEKCKVLLVSPVNMRESLFKKIDREIESAKAGLPAKIIIIINSLSDDQLISKLYEASDAGVEIKMIVRGICCAMIDSKRIQAISILDEYLEHSRIWLFHNRGDDEIYISSCDWEGRNLDKRIEVATPIRDLVSKNELIDIITLKLSDNFKARLQDSSLSNRYFANGKKQVRSQAAIKKYLSQKRYDP